MNTIAEANTFSRSTADSAVSLLCALPTPAPTLAPMLPCAPDSALPARVAKVSRSQAAASSLSQVCCSRSEAALAIVPELLPEAAMPLLCALPTPAPTLTPMLPLALDNALPSRVAS
ncbi:hypothetical protein [Lysobacter enzymogenes]|uniref:Uncharacterized protein n=1 Tax=Lysobacter enzymogenes TaxID=69 RepID=A0A3N2RMT8_LYSEN|nr:hypothetical protein [Lysobacter enzymogenes]ROU08691.1 hypothetical protein D9T17_03300 [Lysobacter enzymogenes]